ncbi:MAG: hypothetical protein WC882_05235 [Candidatus Gracilibacteria bacterium]
MKFKIILIALLTFSLTLLLAAPLVQAADDPADEFTDAIEETDTSSMEGDMPDYSTESTPSTPATDPCDSPANLSSEQKLECLFPNEQALIEGSPQGDQGSTSLPSGNLFTDFLPFFINTALAITGTLIFIALLYGGYLFVMSNDNEESINQGKKIMTYSVIGAIIVAISYAAIYGLVYLNLD